MKINDEIADWFRLCVMCAIGIGMMFGINQCVDEDAERKKKYAEENPVETAQKNSYSIVRVSRPGCWSEGDKIIFRKIRWH